MRPVLLLVRASTSTSKDIQVESDFNPASISYGCRVSCAKVLGADGVSRQVSGGLDASSVRGRRGVGAKRAPGEQRGSSGKRAPGERLISAKIRWVLPKSIKDSVDLPDFVKESVAQIQILCTF